MNLAVLYSGGKDSNLALYRAMKYHNIRVLVNLIPKENSYLYHYPNANLTKLQAKAIEIPIVQKIVKNEEKDLKEILNYVKKEYDVEGIVTGAVRSTYQARIFQKICYDLGLWCFNPLWLNKEEDILREILKLNFDVIIVGFFAYPFKKELIGKKLDENTVNTLIKLWKEYKINPVGEGGEIETFVLDAPFFKKRIKIIDYELKIEENSGILIIKEAKLEDK